MTEFSHISIPAYRDWVETATRSTTPLTSTRASVLHVGDGWKHKNDNLGPATHNT